MGGFICNLSKKKEIHFAFKIIKNIKIFVKIKKNFANSNAKLLKETGVKVQKAIANYLRRSNQNLAIQKKKNK